MDYKDYYDKVCALLAGMGEKNPSLRHYDVGRLWKGGLDPQRAAQRIYDQLNILAWA